MGNGGARKVLSAAFAAFTLGAGSAGAVCTPDRLDARWPGGTARFTVEVADDAAERARGLMHREGLAPMSGMFFVYDREAPVAFWMKNTLIPLDMIFADATGRVVRVHPMAVPGDETPVPSGAPARFVLEIAGGMAARLGLGAGAELRHPAIPAATAAWPCD